MESSTVTSWLAGGIDKIILAFGLALVAGCASLSSPEDPPDTYPVQVYFGTDRAETTSDVPGLDFGPLRGGTSYGVVELEAYKATNEDPSGETEQIEIVATPVETRFVQASSLNAEEFFTHLRGHDDTGVRGKILLFVHGFKRNFRTAAENVSLLTEGIGFDGRTVFWSWPSLDNPGGYLTDRTSLQWTQHHLARFIVDLVEKSDTRQLTLVAHSLGAEGLTQALVEIIGIEKLLEWGVIDNLVLLAPDIDLAIFRRDIAPALNQAGIPTTIYVSSTDFALITSSNVNGFTRVGDASEKVYSFSGIDTIDVTRVAKTGLRHSYYRRSPRVFEDLHRLIIQKQPADLRPGLKRSQKDGKVYWKIRK